MLDSFLQKLLYLNKFQMANGKIELFGSRYIMLDANNLLGLQKIDKTKIYKNAKTSAEEDVKEVLEHAKVYHLLKESMHECTKEVHGHLSNNNEGIVNTLRIMFNLYGLGNLKIIHLNNEDKTAILRIVDSTIGLAQLKKAKTKTCECVLTSGILAGIFSYIFCKNIECIEKKCIARGDKYCEFVIRQ